MFIIGLLVGAVIGAVACYACIYFAYIYRDR